MQTFGGIEYIWKNILPLLHKKERKRRKKDKAHEQAEGHKHLLRW